MLANKETSRVFELNELGDERGWLAVLEGNSTLPFEIKRVFYIYGSIEGVRRGFHAHYKTRQALISISGQCKVYLDNYERKTDVLLDSPTKVLILEPNDWHEMYDFSADCVLLVLASHLYNPEDYIRDYDQFFGGVWKVINYFVHPQAIVETDNIGNESRIWAFSHILPDARIGSNCNINDHTFIENNVSIGNNVTVKSGVYIWDGVTIKDNVFIGPNVTFTNDLRPRSKQYPTEFLKTILEEWVSIGANATIIAGNTIGKYAMVGAGSVVTKNIPNNTLWYGNPAVFKGYVCNCGEKLDELLKCSECHSEYFLENGLITEE